MRFLHVGDVHLGVRFRSRPEAGRKLQAGLREAWTALIGQAIQHRVDAVLIAGDLFETSDHEAVSLGIQSVVLQGMRRLTARHIPVFIAPGNHDPFTPTSIYRRLRWPDGVTVFDSHEPRAVPLDTTDPPATVHGVGFGRADVRENLVARFRGDDDGRFHIGLVHCSVTSAAGAMQHEPYAPCRVEDFYDKGIHYWALGHVHRGGFVLHEPDRPLVAAYGGSLFGLGFDETGPKGCLLVEVTPERRVRTAFLPLAPIRWEQIELTVTPEDDLATVERRIEEAVEQCAASRDEGAVPSGRRAELCVRVVLSGRSGLSRRRDGEWQELGDLLEQRYGLVLLEWQRQLRPAIDWSEYAGQPHVLGQLLERFGPVLEGSASLPEDVWAAILRPDDQLQRPASPQRELQPEALAAYKERLLRRALDLLVNRFVQDEPG